MSKRNRDATNGKLLLKRSSSHSSPVLQQFCLLSGLRDSSGALTSKASSNLLNDDTYRCVCVGNLSSGQIEQGAHYIRKSLIYLTRKVFLECAVVELAINSTRSPTANV